MNSFEFVFTLIGLVLGLSLVEVLSGLTRAFKAKSEIRIGWLTPMLGLWVIAHVASYWGVFWVIRDLLPGVWQTLGAGVLITSGYYLAASMVFPNDIERYPDLDTYYWQHKRQVIGIIFLCTIAFQAFGLSLGRVWSPTAMINNLAVFAGMAVLWWVPGRILNLAGLTVLLGMMGRIFLQP